MDADRRTQDDAAHMPKKLKEGPATARLQIVAPASFVDDVDEWRATQRPPLNRSEAIRELVAKGIAADRKSKASDSQ